MKSEDGIEAYARLAAERARTLDIYWRTLTELESRLMSARRQTLIWKICCAVLAALNTAPQIVAWLK